MAVLHPDQYLFYGGPIHNKIRYCTGDYQIIINTAKTPKLQWSLVQSGIPTAAPLTVKTNTYRLEKIQDFQRDLEGYVYVYQGDRPYHKYKIADCARRRGMLKPVV